MASASTSLMSATAEALGAHGMSGVDSILANSHGSESLAAPRSAALAQGVASAVNSLSPTLAAATTPLLTKTGPRDADDDEEEAGEAERIRIRTFDVSNFFTQVPRARFLADVRRTLEKIEGERQGHKFF